MICLSNFKNSLFVKLYQSKVEKIVILFEMDACRYILALIFVFSTTYASYKWLKDDTIPFSLSLFTIGKNLTNSILLDNDKKTAKNNSCKTHKTRAFENFPSISKFGIVVSPSSSVIQPNENFSITKDLTLSSHKKPKQIEIEVLKEEAWACIRKARQFAESGNRKLAYKLFKHALALAPKFSEALNEFGEFLEKENILQADLMYQRAISCDPNHNTALQNRQRTKPVVAEHDRKVFALIDAKKKELYKYSAHHPTLRAAMKEFYYQHIYHTIALEGSTLSLDQIKFIIDHQTAVAGKSIVEHNEVIGMAEALNYMNNTLLMKIGNITINDIKSIHKRVLGYVDPFGAGEFRTNQVYVGGHIPPHPDDVEIYMEQFQDWLNSEEVLQLHPVEFAAIAHYKLVFIHPFVDGNGRTARLLMNFILMKNGFPPVSIEVEDRWEYYQCLIAANDGDLRPFIRFVADCTYNTLEVYLSVAELPYLKMENKITKKTLPFKGSRLLDV